MAAALLAAPPFVHNGNQYVSARGRGSIPRKDSFGRPPGVGNTSHYYPTPAAMVAWVEGPVEERDNTDDAYAYASHDDRLWMLACAGARDEEERRSRAGYGQTGVLRDLFDMGQYQWSDFHKPSPASLRPIRYASAVGQELLKRIERMETKVGSFSIILISSG